MTDEAIDKDVLFIQELLKSMDEEREIKKQTKECQEAEKDVSS